MSLLTLTETDFPYIDPADVGNIANVGYGTVEKVPCRCIKAGAVTTLTADITATQTSFNVKDASKFPAVPFIIQNGDERINVTAKSNSSFTVVTRAYDGTTAAAHKKDEIVFEAATEYVYLVSSGKLKQIKSVEVDDVILQSTEYVAYSGQAGDAHADYPGKAVIALTAETYIGKQKGNVSYQSYTPAPSRYSDVDMINAVINIDMLGKQSVWLSYAAEKGKIKTQRFTASVSNTGAAWGKIIASVTNLKTGAAMAVKEYIIDVSGSASVEIEITSDVWAVSFYIVPSVGSFSVSGMQRTVERSPIENTNSRQNVSSSARIVIGDRVTVDADWVIDETGDYGGIGNLIERPDWVIKHFISNHMDFMLTDIDSSSFTAAGVLYAAAITGGYKFSFVINDKIEYNKFAKNLAFQCRSTLQFRRDKWYLDYLPDVAPTPVRTISKSSLAGKYSKFTFNKMRLVDIANDLTAKFKRDYSSSGNLGTLNKSDAASKTKYGTYKKDVYFNAIRIQAMADDVMDFILLQRKAQLLNINFKVFWENFSLDAGDTFDINSPLYNGKKFYIENIRRVDKKKVNIIGLEWPG
ncbi:MAG: hypothetical protein HZB61_10400 [Nitrospirae bacterium]|nr:hypothetical protein [Nitrospirota bacterium]